jgi:O-antigen/teichoic acid export membrane protein
MSRIVVSTLDLPTVEESSPGSAPVTITAVPTRHGYFDSHTSSGPVKGNTLRNSAITVGAQAVKFFLRLGSTAVLARLLSPSDFGLIAMVTVITGFVEMFRDSGLSMATLQRATITHAQVSTLYWINIALSTIVMFLVAASAPAISWFYGEPRLVPVTIVLSLTMICGGIAVQPQALLHRNMRFGRLAFAEILSMIAGIVTAIGMARLGCGYWSLVGMTAVTAAATALFSQAFSGWIPSLPRRNSGVRPMLSFGANIVASNMLVYFVRNGDNFVVGRFVGAAALGIYGRAYALLIQPWHQLIAPIESAVMPVLCRSASSREAFVTLYLKALYGIASASFAILLLLAFNAPLVVLLLLGPSWSDVLPVFYGFLPAAAIGAIRPAAVWLFVPLGRVREQLLWNLCTAPIYIASYFAGVSYGAVGVAYAFSICQVALFIPNLLYACRGTFVRPSHIMQALGPPVAALGAASLVFYCFPHASNDLAIWPTVCSGLSFVAICSAGWYHLSRHNYHL